MFCIILLFSNVDELFKLIVLLFISFELLFILLIFLLGEFEELLSFLIVFTKFNISIFNLSISSFTSVALSKSSTSTALTLSFSNK